MRRIYYFALPISVAFLAWGCAKNATDDSSLDGGFDDATTMDSGGCPQWDITKDSKHCGSCTNACGANQICQNSMCKAMCDPPTTKCTTDGGASCVDLSSDQTHCGNCNTLCTVGDGGGLTPGPNNPEAGIPMDGGFDAGPGWKIGMPSCAMSKCATICPMGFIACEDNICYDPQNYHDRCGDCMTACAAMEWCTGGKCCAVGMANCMGTCTNVLGDANNCGWCGNKCPNNTPNCIGGVCTNGYVYTDNFVMNQTPTTACTHWQNFNAGLGNSYNSVKISGTNDMNGIVCNNSVVATGIASALKNNTSYTAACNGHTWSNCARYSGELWIDPPSQCSGNNCPSPGYILRPCIGNANWGGVNTATCTTNPTQTMTLSFF